MADPHVIADRDARVAAVAEENVIDTVRVDRMLVRGGREVFGLRVTGDYLELDLAQVGGPKQKTAAS